MTRFKGADGSEWNIRITIPVLIDIEDSLGISMLSGVELENISVRQVADILWAIVKDQAEARNYTRKKLFEEVVLLSNFRTMLPLIMNALGEAFNFEGIVDTKEAAEKESGPFVLGKDEI